MSLSIVKDEVSTLDWHGLKAPLLLIGAAHSGKSELAIEALNPDLPGAVIGLADTSEPEIKSRVEELKDLRGESYETYEGVEELAPVLQECLQTYPQVLVDSLSHYVATRLVQGSEKYSADLLEAQLSQEIDEIVALVAGARTTRLVMVSSEVGAGLTPPRPLARLFRKVTSRLNMRVANACSSVVLVSAGIPLVLRES